MEVLARLIFNREIVEAKCGRYDRIDKENDATAEPDNEEVGCGGVHKVGALASVDRLKDRDLHHHGHRHADECIRCHEVDGADPVCGYALVVCRETWVIPVVLLRPARHGRLQGLRANAAEDRSDHKRVNKCHNQHSQKADRDANR